MPAVNNSNIMNDPLLSPQSSGGGGETYGTILAGENVTAGRAVFVASDGKAYELDGTEEGAGGYIGVAKTSGTANQSIEYYTFGQLATVSSLTIGTEYWSNDGTMTTYAGLDSSTWCVYIGVAKTTSTLLLKTTSVLFKP